MSENDGSKRRLKPSMTRSVSAPISAEQASTRAMSRSIGFSQSTALPVRTARMSRSTCVGVGDATTTASIDGSSITASTSVLHGAANCSPTSRADDANGSTTRASSARGWTVIESACTRPIRPQPIRPSRTMYFSLKDGGMLR